MWQLAIVPPGMSRSLLAHQTGLSRRLAGLFFFAVEFIKITDWQQGRHHWLPGVPGPAATRRIDLAPGDPRLSSRAIAGYAPIHRAHVGRPAARQQGARPWPKVKSAAAAKPRSPRRTRRSRWRPPRSLRPRARKSRHRAPSRRCSRQPPARVQLRPARRRPAQRSARRRPSRRSGTPVAVHDRQKRGRDGRRRRCNAPRYASLGNCDPCWCRSHLATIPRSSASRYRSGTWSPRRTAPARIRRSHRCLAASRRPGGCSRVLRYRAGVGSGIALRSTATASRRPCR